MNTQFKTLIQHELDRLQPLAGASVPTFYGVHASYAKGKRNGTLLMSKQPTVWFSLFRVVSLFLF